MSRILITYKIRGTITAEGVAMGFSPASGKYFRVARHQAKDLAKGTAEAILKDAGLK
jgi:hypothetical protein